VKSKESKFNSYSVYLKKVRRIFMHEEERQSWKNTKIVPGFMNESRMMKWKAADRAQHVDKTPKTGQ